MNICAIVCEFDPYHLGHRYLIDECRRAFGADAAVVCVMSGDFVQRGAPAAFLKHDRARAAVAGGADLVLELPLPWSMAPAETFARGAAGLLGACGLSARLCFGSESGDLTMLQKTAELLLGPETDALIRKELESGIGYASARLSCAGAGSAILFARAAEHGARYHPNQFLIYDAGGVGGEIGGDVVLLGGKAFLRSMGIAIPEDVKLPRALYIAVNGQAEGVFAVNYRPSEAVKSGLAALAKSRAQILLASRDVLVTPQMVEAKYGVPPERITVLPHRERDALLETEDAPAGAMLSRSGFYPFALAVSGARKLRRAVRGSFASSLLGAVLGLLLMTLLTLTDAHAAASVWNLWLYQALWLIPMGLLTQGV